MGAFCCCCCKPKNQIYDKKKRTSTGKLINKSIVTHFLTIEEQIWLRSNLLTLNDIFSHPSNHFDQITEYLYLTGFGGINEENIIKYNIKHVINATYELPEYKVLGVDCIKIAVDDSEYENISLFFDFTSDKINEWIQKKESTVVHCLCGISRSATIVLAMSLRNAFNYVHQKRDIICPNFAFFKQLIQFEKRLKNAKSPTKMVEVMSPNKQTKVMPEFLVTYYPGIALAGSKQPKDSTLDLTGVQSYLSSYSRTY